MEDGGEGTDWEGALRCSPPRLLDTGSSAAANMTSRAGASGPAPLPELPLSVSFPLPVPALLRPTAGLTLP